jgi:hypothetical protein
MKRNSGFERRRLVPALVVTVVMLVPLAVFGAPALARNASAAAEYEYGSSGQQYGGKVTICHHTHSKKHPGVTITIGAKAAKQRVERHHDSYGACPTTASTQTTTTSGSDEHGQGHGNGNGHGHGHDKSNDGDNDDGQ